MDIWCICNSSFSHCYWCDRWWRSRAVRRSCRGRNGPYEYFWFCCRKLNLVQTGSNLIEPESKPKKDRTGLRFLTGGPRGRTVVRMSPPDTFCPKPFNSFIFSPAMTHSLWVTIYDSFPNFDLCWSSGRAKLIYLTSFDLREVTASQQQ